ncbi:MAG: LysR family transcriptional regulator [Microbacterium gubbeenense]|uniref:LysR family transcriptional regulator n=2 Tax=Microbacterium gubbeenense TaxID=159896 RepID=UPI000415931E
MMTLEQLRGFVEVARTGHFTRAAERLHLAQPSLSRQISALERALGVDLFHRARGNISLTAAGAHLLPIARRMLADAATAHAEMAELAGLTRGTARLGMTPTLGTSIVADVLAAYRERYPGVDIEVVERGSRTLINDLSEGRLDLALIVTTVSSAPARAVLDREPLLTERLVAVTSAAGPDPFAGADAISLASLAAEPYVELADDYDLRTAMDAAFDAAGLQPPVAVTGAEMDAALTFAERGIGVTVVPAMVATGRPGLRTTRLSDSALTRTISLARRGDMPLTHAAAALRDLIREVTARATAPESPLAPFVSSASEG